LSYRLRVLIFGKAQHTNVCFSSIATNTGDNKSSVFGRYDFLFLFYKKRLNWLLILIFHLAFAFAKSLMGFIFFNARYTQNNKIIQPGLAFRTCLVIFVFNVLSDLLTTTTVSGMLKLTRKLYTSKKTDVSNNLTS
jgi:hypothetical protein